MPGIVCGGADEHPYHSATVDIFMHPSFRRAERLRLVERIAADLVRHNLACHMADVSAAVLPACSVASIEFVVLVPDMTTSGMESFSRKNIIGGDGQVENIHWGNVFSLMTTSPLVSVLIVSLDERVWMTRNGLSYLK